MRSAVLFLIIFSPFCKKSFAKIQQRRSKARLQCNYRNFVFVIIIVPICAAVKQFYPSCFFQKNTCYSFAENGQIKTARRTKRQNSARCCRIWQLRKLESKEAFAWKDHRFESYPAKEQIMTSIPKVRNIRCAVITQNRLGADADTADEFRRWVLRIRRRVWNQNRSFVHVII